MRVLFLYLEESVRHMVQLVLEAEGYTIVATRSAAEAIRIIEDSTNQYVLLTDNFSVNSESLGALTTLCQHPELRQRVTVIGVSARSDVMSTSWMTGRLLDDHLMMPYTYDQLLAIIERYTGGPPRSGAI